MYAINVTRINDELNSDMLVGKNSMDAKRKMLNYIVHFLFANYQFNIDCELLDQQLNIELFSLKDFMINNYGVEIDKDLIIQSIPTDKEHCIFLKFFNEKTDKYPALYVFNKDELNQARHVFTFLINDSLINNFKDILSEYEKYMLDYDNGLNSYSNNDIKCNIISLYREGLFLEELLNNDYSLKDLRKKDFGDIAI